MGLSCKHKHSSQTEKWRHGKYIKIHYFSFVVGYTQPENVFELQRCMIEVICNSISVAIVKIVQYTY